MAHFSLFAPLSSRFRLLDAELLARADNCRVKLVPLHNLLDRTAIALGNKSENITLLYGVGVTQALGTLFLQVCRVEVLLQVECIFAVNLLLDSNHEVSR